MLNLPLDIKDGIYTLKLFCGVRFRKTNTLSYMAVRSEDLTAQNRASLPLALSAWDKPKDQQTWQHKKIKPALWCQILKFDTLPYRICYTMNKAPLSGRGNPRQLFLSGPPTPPRPSAGSIPPFRLAVRFHWKWNVFTKRS